MNKRGLSAIITTLLVVMLVLVAVGIVWGVVRGITRSGAEGVGSGSRCVRIDVIATAINCNIPSECAIILKRTGFDDDAIGGVKLVFFEGTDSSGVIDEEGNIEALAGKTVTVDSTFDALDKLEVTVYLEDEFGNEHLCEAQTNSFDINEGIGGGEEPPEGGDCVSECGLRICGPDPDPDCEDPCGTCVSGTCSENGLECIGCTPQTCEDLEYECGTPDDGCGVTLDCDTPGCDVGDMCSDGICIPVTSLDFGIVEEVWPGDSGMYFASNDLPDWDDTDPDFVDYSNYYLSYTDTTECVLIANHVTTDISGYDKPHAAFSFSTSIVIGDDYYIWNTPEECVASI